MQCVVGLRRLAGVRPEPERQVLRYRFALDGC